MPPDVISDNSCSGTGEIGSKAPLSRLRTVQLSIEISAVWPSSNAAWMPRHSNATKPKLTALRKKRPLIDSATSAPSPRLRSERAAGRLDPVPKLRPPIRMSPGRTSSTQPGRFAENTARRCSSSLAVNSGPGSIRSVLMSSPNFHTRPITIPLQLLALSACHCEERSDEAISRRARPVGWGLLRFARNDIGRLDAGGVGDMAGDRRGGDRRRRGHVDARRRVAHPAFEIAGRGGDAGLAGAEDTHMAAIAGAAGRWGHHGAGVEQ